MLTCMLAASRQAVKASAVNCAALAGIEDLGSTLDDRLTQGIEAFVTSVSGVFRRSKTLRRESRALAALRDALLPRLISGDVRV